MLEAVGGIVLLLEQKIKNSLKKQNFTFGDMRNYPKSSISFTYKLKLSLQRLILDTPKNNKRINIHLFILEFDDRNRSVEYKQYQLF